MSGVHAPGNCSEKDNDDSRLYNILNIGEFYLTVFFLCGEILLYKPL